MLLREHGKPTEAQCASGQMRLCFSIRCRTKTASPSPAGCMVVPKTVHVAPPNRSSSMPLLHKANRPKQLPHTLKVWLHWLPRSNIKSVQSAPDSRQTCAIIRKYAKQHNVALSNLFPTRQNKPRPAARQLELTDLSIEEGTFLNADGTHAAIGGHFTVAGKGVYTSLPESMQHLPQESKPLCKHELALIVLREPVPAPKRPCEKVVFTALDHTGNKLILAGWIIQFGEGKVSIAKPDRFDVPVPSCTIFCVHNASRRM